MVKVTDTVKYMGVDDNTLDLFESQYVIPEGISYNSYVILDGKIAVIDTVDNRMMKEWEENLLAVLDKRSVDYLIIQHLEPDHTGGIVRLLELFPDITLVGNQKTFLFLSQFFEFESSINTLCLGSHTLTFYMATMVHWPEVMVTYDNLDKIFFSADAFGKFGSLEKTADEDWACEARRYYFNICGKYGVAVQALLNKVKNLDVDYICPLHGMILQDNSTTHEVGRALEQKQTMISCDKPLSYYIDLYDMWSSYKPESEGVLVAYASIHGNTAKVARKMAEILREKGVKKVVVKDLAREDMAEVLEDAFRYDRMILAAASYDAGVFPCMQDFLHHLQSKAYQNRKVAIVENGSWACKSGTLMKKLLDEMKEMTILPEQLTLNSALNDSKRNELVDLADAIVESVKMREKAKA